MRFSSGFNIFFCRLVKIKNFIFAETYMCIWGNIFKRKFSSTFVSFSAKLTFMNGESVLSEMENLFMALADKTRLRILNLMREGEVCVQFFTEVLGESQPKISRHLAYLRNARIVSARREGKWIHYKIEMPKDFNAAKVLSDILQWLAAQDEMRKDYENLIAAFNSSYSINRIENGDVLPKSNMSSGVEKRKEDLEIFLL
jgi:ArsR family transcriptional regulator